MDRSALSELSGYTRWAWERTARSLDEVLPHQYMARPPGLGWSLSECVTHVLTGYDAWLHEMLGRGPRLVPQGTPPPEWPVARKLHEKLLARADEALREDDASLFEPRVLMRGDDQVAPRSLADVVADLLLHERGHYGDFTTFLHAFGVKPYFNDYIIFKTQPGAWYRDE